MFSFGSCLAVIRPDKAKEVLRANTEASKQLPDHLLKWMEQLRDGQRADLPAPKKKQKEICEI